MILIKLFLLVAFPSAKASLVPESSFLGSLFLGIPLVKVWLWKLVCSKPLPKLWFRCLCLRPRFFGLAGQSFHRCAPWWVLQGWFPFLSSRFLLFSTIFLTVDFALSLLVSFPCLLFPSSFPWRPWFPFPCQNSTRLFLLRVNSSLHVLRKLLKSCN